MKVITCPGGEADLPIEVARYVLAYEPDTGLLRWKVYVGGNSRPGSVAGCLSTHSKGYVTVSLFGRRYLAHRLAWFIHYGVWPTGLIDHRNGQEADNRLDNMRDVDFSQNVINRPIPSNNTSGVKGVHFNRRRGKWVATITANGKTTALGHHETREAAAAAYERAARHIHGEFARHAASNEEAA